MIDEKWAKFFSSHHFLVGISIDGFKQNHDVYRNNSFEQIIKNLKYLDQYQVPYNILTVLTHSLSQKPNQLFDFYIKNKFDYVQIIPCLSSLNHSEDFALSKHDFYSFYKVFFDRWYKYIQKGHFLSISLFESIMAQILGYPCSICGMNGSCINQWVIEANGNVYPCDFYCLDDYYMGNIHLNSLEDLKQSEGLKKFLNLKTPKSKLCNNCRYEKMCQGNCKRMANHYYDDTYCGYQHLLDDIYDKLFMLTKKIR